MITVKAMPKPVPVSVFGIKQNKVHATQMRMPRMSFSIVRAAEAGSWAGAGADARADGDVASSGAGDGFRYAVFAQP